LRLIEGKEEYRINFRGFLFGATYLIIMLLFLGCKCGNNESSSDSGKVFEDAGSYKKTFSIGGTLSGLTAGSAIVLQNNSKDDLSLQANEPFTFPTKLVDGMDYEVTIHTQPEGQSCIVKNRSGTLSGGNVTNVSVVCTNNKVETFTIGGTVRGLSGTGLVLKNNGDDDLAISANGVFVFATTLTAGSHYNVTISAQPKSRDQVCSVTNGSGTLGTVNITDIAVICSDAPVRIVGFSVSSQLVSSGDDVILSWTTRGATSCEIAPSTIQAVPVRTGNMRVAVSETTAFILTCKGVGGPVSSAAVKVYVTDADWAQVSAGSDHTCALKTDGRLFCWGHGSFGGLGNNFKEDSLIPVQENTEAYDWTQVSAAEDHTCAVKTDGRLFCWGYGGGSVLGNGLETHSSIPVQESTKATDWAEVSTGIALPFAALVLRLIPPFKPTGES